MNKLVLSLPLKTSFAQEITAATVLMSEFSVHPRWYVRFSRNGTLESPLLNLCDLGIR